MPRRLFPLILALAACPSATARGDDAPTFERDVKPLLARRCNACHNAGKLDQPDVSAGLALDSFEAALKGTPSHPVVVPGKAAESELVKRLTDPDDDRRMPLQDKTLAPADQALIRRWVETGAERGVAVAPVPVAARPRRPRAAALDVLIPVAAHLPKGKGPEGPLRLALKVGPLPPVTALSFGADGRWLAVGTHGAVVLWDLREGRPAALLPGIPGQVLALTFSRDGKRLALGAGLPARGGSVRVYAVPDGTLLHDFAGHTDSVTAVAFRVDGGQLASSSFDQSVRLWDLGTGRPAGVFRGHSDFVNDVAFAGDGESVLSVGKDRAVKRINLTRLKELQTYSDHESEVLALAVRPGKGTPTFVTAGQEPELRWWSAGSEKPAQKVSGHGGPVHQLAFAADGSRLISAGGDGTVRLWDGASGAAQRTLAGPTDWQYAVALSADGQRAAAGGREGLVWLWKAETGQAVATFVQPPGVEPGAVEWLAVAPSGEYAASPALTPLARWQVGDVEVGADLTRPLFDRPEVFARLLRGEPSPP